MYIEVILEDDINCPRCEKLLPLLKKICDELNIPFTVKFLNNRAVAVAEECSAFKTFSREWIGRFGLPEHKRGLKKFGWLLDYLQKTGAQPFPVIVIRWHDGVRPREIVIRGFDDSDKEKVREFTRNLMLLLMTLKKALWGH